MPHNTCPAGQPWTAQFIALASPERVAQPCWLRREVELREAPQLATLRVTALGAHETLINGNRPDDHVLAPGWTSYDKRVVFESHDVTSLLRAGSNVLGVRLAGAWRTERYGFFGRGRRIYGEQPSYSAELHIRYPDGSEQVILTDDQWSARGDLEIVHSSLYQGEEVDLQRERATWALPGDGADGWHPVAIEETALLPMPKAAPPVRCTHELDVVAVLETPSGATVLDFGQNLVGRLRVTLDAPAGTRITLRHAEVMEHGELGVRPLRSAAQTDVFTLAGGPTVLEPTFTFHGFRYVQVDGWPGKVDPDAFTARVLMSDMAPTASFDCSHELVSRLHENVVWGMRGNFLSVPTDCPQRDERLGWTGDIQVFAATAATLYDCHAFLSDWLVDLRMEQATHDGLVPFVVPDALGDEVKPTAVWGDAATLVPWTLYERYGDPRVLAAQFESMTAWVQRLLERAGDDLLWEGSMQFGDWLDPDAPPEEPGAAKVSRDIVATAYVARSTQVLADAAAVLGRTEESAHYAALARRIRRAFADAYVTPAGRMMSDAPTAYALAICFDLVTDRNVITALGDRLAERVRTTGYRISTGFVGTPLILHALTATGHDETAGRLLLQTGCPSWLYPVTMGATTIWERWDAMLPDGSINPGEMTSFNHYALGAVADWLHRTLAGLSVVAPGGTRLRIQPRPIDGVDWAKSEQVLPHGTASVAWRRDGDALVVDAQVPEGSTAEVALPGESVEHVGAGQHTFRSPWPVRERQPVSGLSIHSQLSTLIDAPGAPEAIREVLGAFSPGYAESFFRRTSWTEGCQLVDVLFGVPPHVRDDIDARLAQL